MNNIKGDTFIAYESLKRRKVRSFLTVLAIVIGIFSVVSLISIGEGFLNTIDEISNTMGSNSIMIMPGGGITDFSASTSLTDDDVEVIEKVDGIEMVATMYFKMARTEYNDKLNYAFLISMEQKDFQTIFEKLYGITVESGRFIKSSEKHEVVVGYLLANDENNIFGRKIDLGKKLVIEGVDFEVVGVIEQIGNPGDDSQIYISNQDLEELFGKQDGYYMLLATSAAGYDVASVSEKVSSELRKSRDLKVGEEDFNVQTYAQMLESFMSIFAIISAVIVGVASISLIVGSVGIANTMFTAVLERTKEIGTMKAVGATNFDITFIFVIEAGVMGILGGIIGVFLGYAAAYLTGYAALALFNTVLTIKISWPFVFYMLLFSLVLGLVSGYFPARRASKMNVSEALRYE